MGGIVPDLICRDEEGNPVLIIEVVVTNSPNPAKRQELETLTKRGVDCVEVEVKTEEELKNLCWVPARFNFPSYDGREELHRVEVNISMRERRMQDANKSVDRLIADLLACSPKHLRQLLKVLRGLGGLESTWRTHPKNPLRGQLKSNSGGDNSTN